MSTTHAASSYLMLLDTPALYFRAFHGVPDSVTAPDGTPVNAVRGLLDMIARLVNPGRDDRAVRARPARLVACMDADWRPAFRVAAMPSYKAHRLGPGGAEIVPPALTAQIPVIEEVLDAAGIARGPAPGYEADDVIGTLAARADVPVDIVTGDRDLFQLVDDARQVRVLYTARGFARLEVVDEAAVTARYDIPGRAYADFAALRGDPSDGLPGVRGIGAKTAAALVRRFGTVDAMLAALDKDPVASGLGSSRAKLAADRDYLAAAMPVVLVATDAPIPPLDDALPAQAKDPPRLAELGGRWNLGSSLSRLLSALEARGS
ncbi:MAG TPA: 5'-3' exonuclease [Streptosporangiaceae bacterium]|nr:5'-3' exonuclease [Streptosporangiaceae bacterium]